MDFGVTDGKDPIDDCKSDAMKAFASHVQACCTAAIHQYARGLAAELEAPEGASPDPVKPGK